MLEKYRDLTLMTLDDKKLAIACDSCAGVGMLEHDTIKADAFTVGYLSTVVPLMECLAIGSKPMLIINTLSVANDTYGNSLIKGVMQAAKEAGMHGDHVVTGSTEDNFIVPVTSIGITVIAQLESTLPQSITEPCKLMLVGLPKVGQAVADDQGEILTLTAMRTIKQHVQVVDILPVGSKGIDYEVSVMCRGLDALFIEGDHTIDGKQSAGPATCALVAIPYDAVSDLHVHVDLPITKLGDLLPKNA